MSVTALPSTAAVASELVELCRAGKNLEAIDRLYSPNIHSIEPVGDKQMPAELHGVDAVRVKNEWWFANHDIHRAEVNGPFLGEDQFAVQLQLRHHLQADGTPHGRHRDGAVHRRGRTGRPRAVLLSHTVG